MTLHLSPQRTMIYRKILNTQQKQLIPSLNKSINLHSQNKYHQGIFCETPTWALTTSHLMATMTDLKIVKSKKDAYERSPVTKGKRRGERGFEREETRDYRMKG
ncbi:hypothetical protein TSUD_300770 [Trifolium subterraneum]|uniref:Uncharacterized protein n=1 Tax=Trifolium subterraneum TaxID=3900 RepID=A0A2Z6P1Z6_TRISU|nr:hypothetical protein TSUD_300770 [Trifolium subterraneum]